jgi:hypothetical protein
MRNLNYSKSIFLCVLAGVLSVNAAGEARPAPSSGAAAVAPVNVDESDWTVYMGAPAYHFGRAKEYLEKNEPAKAAAELNRANEFLAHQKSRLTFAEKQVEGLSRELSSGKKESIRKLDSVASVALKIINRKYVMVPLDVEPASVFENAFDYHAEAAKARIVENDRAGSVSEIRKAEAFLKLRAAHMGRMAQAAVDSAENTLKDLAAKVESGAVKETKDLDRAFKKALADVVSKKE